VLYKEIRFILANKNTIFGGQKVQAYMATSGEGLMLCHNMADEAPLQECL
jgi:hypothetical protein